MLSTLAFLDAGPVRADLGSNGPDLTNYLLVCAVLIGSVALLGFAFRKLVGKSVKARAAKRSLEVVDLLPLGSKQRLAVVRCYDRTFALGLGEKEIALIAELDPVVAPADRKPTTRADDHAFQRALEKLRENDVKPAKPKAGERAIAGELFG